MKKVRPTFHFRTDNKRNMQPKRLCVTERKIADVFKNGSMNDARKRALAGSFVILSVRHHETFMMRMCILQCARSLTTTTLFLTWYMKKNSFLKEAFQFQSIQK